MTKALILSGCLVAAGAASASERSVIVPVIAGAAVGAVLATAISGAGHDAHRAPYQAYRPQPRYQPVYQPVAYVPVAQRIEYRRFAPPPSHRYYGRGDYRPYDRHIDHRNDGRW